MEKQNSNFKEEIAEVLIIALAKAGVTLCSAIASCFEERRNNQLIAITSETMCNDTDKTQR